MAETAQAADSTRTLHLFNIRGTALAAYDERGSDTADRVARELYQDAYGLERIPFAPGDVAIDIGAHVGLVSIYLAKRWPALRIHAFEPHPANYRNAVDNLRLNHLGNVHLAQLAVSADRRPLILQSLPLNTGGASAVFDMPGACSSPAVPSVTLDDIFAMSLAPGQRCRLLKIDCEGIELEILPSPLLERVDFLAAEFHVDVRGDGHRANADAVRTLTDQCAQYFQPDHVRIGCCHKQD